MSKTGNNPLPCSPIHPQPNTNDGRQILDQQENVSHRCFPRRASRKTSPTRPQPLAQFKGVPTFPSPKHTRPFLLFPQAHAAEKAIRRSVLYTSQRTTPQMRTHHVPDTDVSRPRCGRITSQTRACLDPDALTSLIFRASLIINLLILSKWKISVVTTGKLVGNLRDKRNHHTTPR